MLPIYLVCGVPGSGKTWVCEQLRGDFLYVSHDDYIGEDYAKAVLTAAKTAHKPVLADCPFAERILRDRLEKGGFTVLPYFIVEDGQTVRRRYEARENKPIPSAHITRSISIKTRAEEWRAPFGKSHEVLQMLKKVNSDA